MELILHRVILIKILFKLSKIVYGSGGGVCINGSNHNLFKL